MGALTVIANRKPQGWALSLKGEDGAIAEVRTLDTARQRTVDHLNDADPHVDHSEWTITVVPADPADAQKIRAVREGTAAAAHAQETAARATRDLITELTEKQYRSADIAGLLGISRGRVSQLLAESRTN